MIKGVIFDMDGLMFDTERIWATLWEPALAALGLSYKEGLDEAARGTAGDSMRACCAGSTAGLRRRRHHRGLHRQADDGLSGTAAQKAGAGRAGLAGSAAHPHGGGFLQPDGLHPAT